MHAQQPPKPDLAKFSEWSDLFREATVQTDGAPGSIEGPQREESLRRQAEYHPTLTTARDGGFFDRMRQSLADTRAQKHQFPTADPNDT